MNVIKMNDKPPNLVQQHQIELIEVIKYAHRLSNEKSKKSFPSRHSPFIWSQITGGSVSDWCQSNQSIAHSIRQIHDFYGWMARHGKNGLCAGTLYRTTNYLNIDMTSRDGSKRSSRNIHIEHTVPVADLNRLLWQSSGKLESQSAENLHELLIKHSICVAFSKHEEAAIGAAGIPSSRNHAFNEDGTPGKEYPYPFRRYLPLVQELSKQGLDFNVINIVSNKSIDLQNFTFADHLSNLELVCNIALPGKVPSIYSLEALPN